MKIELRDELLKELNKITKLCLDGHLAETSISPNWIIEVRKR